MKALILSFSFLSLILFTANGFAQTPQPTCHPRQISWFVCDGTCNYCANSWQQDYAYPKNVNQLPYNFSYSHNDTNTGNDVCGSSDCGTKNCNAGTTNVGNGSLPMAAGYCSLSPNNSIPAVYNCGWADGSCQSYCSRGHTEYGTVCDWY